MKNKWGAGIATHATGDRMMPSRDSPGSGPGDSAAALEPSRHDLTVIVCVYNEGQNLPGFLTAALAQRGPSFQLRELLCVASGCTDDSIDHLRAWERKDARVRPILEPERAGKAAALAQGMTRARGDLILLANADTIPRPGAFEALAAPFRDPAIGLVCARLKAVGGAGGFTSRLSDLLWDVHDTVSADLPKSTGAVSFRSGTIPLPADIEDDDTYLGIRLGRERGRSVYARDGVFLHRAATTPADFLQQRYRINRQILGLYRRTGLLTSTWRPALMVRCAVRYARQHPDRIPLLVALTVLEIGIRTAAVAGRLARRRPLTTWAPIPSTKRAIDPALVRD
jgi:poly-beta-1,6-N-acetyl-D-glucosamine synthase